LLDRIRASKDFWSGALYLVIGVGAVIIAQDYRMGTAVKMGPGYFPVLLGGLLALIGAISMARAFWRPGEPIEGFALKGLVLITAGMLLTGFLFRRAGLVVALPLLILVVAYASARFRWKPTLLLAIGMTAFCILVFAKALGLPLPIVGTWFAGWFGQ
jgi:hypothetical protein